MGLGLGWGGIITSLHLRSHALLHLRHATLLCLLIYFHTYVMGLGLGWGGIKTSLHLRSHALPHLLVTYIVSGKEPKNPFQAVCLPKSKDAEMYSCGNACVAFSGDGNIQEKICVNTRRKPCERCEKSADHEHGTFLSLKHWKGYYSKNRRSFFLRQFETSKLHCHCGETQFSAEIMGR